MNRKDELKHKLSKLYGLEPFNTPENLSYGDGYFAESIKREYSVEEIKTAKKELGIKI